VIPIKSNIAQFHWQKGYYIKNNQLIFLFDERLYREEQLQNIEMKNVAVRGSFNAWEANWKLTKTSNFQWQLEKPLTNIQVPGNSGQPEFKFVINGDRQLTAYHNLPLHHKIYDGHTKGYKNVIIFTPEKAEKIAKINKRLDQYKTDYSSLKELANFRQVDLGEIASHTLYRSYHPFIKSKTDHPLEKERLKAVRKLINQHEIASIINLSDTESEIPDLLPRYQKMIDKKNILFPNREHQYDIYYYITDSKDFALLLKEIINFILTHPTPILLHCRIGTDRTGVISALLAAFMGASWKEIAADYKQSNQTGLKEYRDEKLLAYGFKKLLGSGYKDNLQSKLKKYFRENLNLTAVQIDQLREKLTSK
jgi:protein tyrosine/serine phosphatase